jgi:Ca-activated chloride channel family protein
MGSLRHKLIVATTLMALLTAACGGDAGDAGQTTTTAAGSSNRIDGSRPETTAAPSLIGEDTGRADSVRAPETTTTHRPEEPTNTEFRDYGVSPPTDTREEAISTFAVDVDTGAYTLMRAWVEQGYLPDRNAVRVEEYVNYFDGGYSAPRNGTFAVYADGGPTPFFDRDTELLRVGIKAREVAERQRQDINLTLVIDTSGSMKSADKMTMVRQAIEVLIGELDGSDTVAIVDYDSNAEVALEPTPADEVEAIERAMNRIRAEGSTNAEAGLNLGYDLADEMYDRDSVNRVVLISDGVANVGETGPEGILDRIGDRARDGIDLVTIGVGIETYNDALLEQLADQGNGWYAYIDSEDEAERIFRDNLTTSLEAVARDVKVQVEFDEELVEEYRLVGFENRALDTEDFRDDEVDAGDINAGHSVTALYEVRLTREAYRSDAAFATVRLRWEDAASGDVEEIEGEVTTQHLESRYSRTDPHFQLASTVAAYAEVLRDSPYVAVDLRDVLDEAEAIEIGTNDVDEFIDLVRQAVRLER